MRTVSIGNDRFDTLREKNCFYVDKTDFIREWWESEALAQIENKNYDAALTAKGIPKERIRHYSFAFEGKRVLIGSNGV